jgi:hypothetical protein
MTLMFVYLIMVIFGLQVKSRSLINLQNLFIEFGLINIIRGFKRIMMDLRKLVIISDFEAYSII